MKEIKDKILKKETSLRNNGVIINSIHFCVGDKLVEENEVIKSELDKYFCSLKWYSKERLNESFNKIADDYDLFNMNSMRDIYSYFERYIKRDYIDIFYNHLNRKILFDYLKTEPYLKQQTRRKNRDKGKDSRYKGQSENYEYINNLLYKFSADKYRELTRTDVDYNYVAAALKILFFFKLQECLKDYIGKLEMNNHGILTLEHLVYKAAAKIDDALITGIELSDTLTTKIYLYEDYYYELGQVHLGDTYSLSINNLQRQNLWFRFEDPDKYKTDPKRNVNGHIIFKRAIDGHSKSIRVIVRLFGEKKIKKVLPDIESIPHLPDLDKYSLQQTFNEYILGEVFHSSEEYENSFHSIRKFRYSPDVKFIKKNIGISRGTSIKATLTLLIDNFKRASLIGILNKDKKINKYNRNVRLNEIDNLSSKLKSKKNNKPKAIIDMYNYFELQVGGNA